MMTAVGSAMVGGYIIDKYGIVTNFVCTVIIQIFASTIPLLFISNLIPDEVDTADMSALRQDITDSGKRCFYSIINSTQKAATSIMIGLPFLAQHDSNDSDANKKNKTSTQS